MCVYIYILRSQEEEEQVIFFLFLISSKPDLLLIRMSAGPKTSKGPPWGLNSQKKSRLRKTNARMKYMKVVVVIISINNWLKKKEGDQKGKKKKREGFVCVCIHRRASLRFDLGWEREWRE